jgi:hypothetical protein
MGGFPPSIDAVPLNECTEPVLDDDAVFLYEGFPKPHLMLGDDPLTAWQAVYL